MRIEMTRAEVEAAVKAKVAADSAGLMAVEKVEFHERGGATVEVVPASARSDQEAGE